MQRRALAQAAATAALLAVALAGCTGSDQSSGAVDSQTGGAGAASVPVPSGKYSTLPEPCTALSAGTLEDLLPGTADEESDEDAEEALAGEPDLTYDADRQVGCRWERETTEGGHKLELQFERIVSYDDEVSDDQQAAQIYAERAEEHDVDVSSGRPDLPDKAETGNASGGVPATGESGPPGGGKDGDAGASDEPGSGGSSGEAGGEDSEGGTGESTPGSTDASTDGSTDDSTGSGTGSPDGDSSPAETIAPRLLDDIGDESFLDDKTAGASSGVQRKVTVVFRTSNVVVTVTYDQWHTAGAEPTDGAELQQRAQQVADRLADQLAD
ncbi:hypothetical protein OG946_21465 [Streptomyces sp. NBC_01808]|uniref:hypothetical protein n=1 Tax=Streptomyces sp. NBC_01808 TaxID=2975947 RepID=UPI002DD87043|nr:hypothetical protein [Streptomyces sp. NBC_01808]WSA39707.1 hypothetical protein OG946_21465 [Streptomyces sp. NBC_01808]